MIEQSLTSTNYQYENLTGICAVRGDRAFRLQSSSFPDVNQDLAHFFDDPPTDRQFINRFNVLPLCIGFIVTDVQSESVLIYAANEPMITIGDGSIEFTLGGRSATFTSLDLVGISTVSRVQICIDGSNAVLYEDCTELETVEFSGIGLPSVSFMGVLGEPFVLNDTTLFTVSC